MRPNRGTCTGVFLLSYANRLKLRSDLAELVRAAKSLSSYMTAALDFDRLIRDLSKAQLIRVNERCVQLEKSLQALSISADRATLINIARVILLRTKPVWLRFAVKNGRLFREYIPQEDLDEIEWMQDDLDRVLIDVHMSTYAALDNIFNGKFGNAAELLVIHSLEYAGNSPIHVAAISDAFGYDIEYTKDNLVTRLEIKAASINTSGRFFISRNEYEKSKHFGNQWKLIQLTFDNEVFSSGIIRSQNVVSGLMLRCDVLASLVPADTSNFIWQESAKIITTAEMWEPLNFEIAPSFTHTFQS